MENSDDAACFKVYTCLACNNNHTTTYSYHLAASSVDLNAYHDGKLCGIVSCC